MTAGTHPTPQQHPPRTMASVQITLTDTPRGRLAPAAQVFAQQALQHVAKAHREEFSRFGL